MKSKDVVLKKFIDDSDFIYSAWKSLSIEGFNTKILDIGQGEIIFQTPIAQNMEPFWTPLIKMLSASYRVITFQRREDTNIFFNAWDRAKDIKLVLDYLKIENCHFISHSSGAIANMHFSLLYPHYVKSMVIMNAAAYYPNLHGLISQLSNKVSQLIPNNLLFSIFMSFIAEKKTDDFIYHKYAFKRFIPFKRYMKYSLNHIIATHDVRENLYNIKCPTLLINRINDKVVPMTLMEYLEARLPNCYGLKTVEGGGHMFHYKNSEPIYTYIMDFYKNILDK